MLRYKNADTKKKKKDWWSPRVSTDDHLVGMLAPLVVESLLWGFILWCDPGFIHEEEENRIREV